MALVFNVNGKDQEIKFDFKTLFKANRSLSSKNPETGERNNDGALNLFSQINDGSEEGIINLIQLTSGKKNTTEDHAIEAMAKYMEESDLDEEEAYNQIFKDVKEEILNSGFFVGKLKKQVEKMEQGAETVKKHGTDEQKAQIGVMEDMISSVKKEIY
jgi:polyhydroxyalkanoate synthesis regulator phasin